MNDRFNELDKVLYKRRATCAVCEKELSDPVISLPKLPLTEIFIDFKPDRKMGFVDQNFHLCDHCGHVQLSSIVDPKVLYGFSYSFRTTQSAASIKGNNVYLDFINGVIKERHFKNIVEIGCNDAYLLNLLKGRGERLIGIDPTMKGKEQALESSQISIIGDYFENMDIKKMFSSGDTLVLSSHNMEHIEDPRSTIKTLLDNSSDKNVFVFQFPGLETLVEDCRFDQIFSHHYHYFSLRSFEYLVNDLGGEMMAFDVNRPHWGSLLVAFRKGNNRKRFLNSYSDKINREGIVKRYKLFKERMLLANEAVRMAGAPIFGYGAALTLPVVAYHLDNDLSEFSGIVDDDPAREGKFYLNLTVPIVNSSRLKDVAGDATILITALNNSRQILPKLVELNPKRIILPVNDI